MLTRSLLIATIFSLLLSEGAAGWRVQQSAKSPGNKSQTSQNEKDKPPTQEEQPSANELKIVAEGFHSSITKPFIAVIRDQETYSELAKLEPTLRKLDVDLKTNILVAAFLGERNTAGYSVEILQSQSGEIQISEKRPGKDMMVAQMITSPFKLVSVALSKAMPVKIEFDSAWNAAVNHYAVTKGTFGMSGGFAGRHESFELIGEISLMRLRHLVSLQFTLRNKSENNEVMLQDFATGKIDGGEIKVPVMGAGDLIKPPTNGLEATGKLTNHEQNLSLFFASLPTMIADGYGGGGAIEAVRVIPTAKNSPLVKTNHPL